MEHQDGSDYINSPKDCESKKLYPGPLKFEAQISKSVAGKESVKMKLYYVECCGMKYASTGVPHGLAYVLANDPNEAYNKLRHMLDKNDFGFSNQRCLEKVTLLAEVGLFPECERHLIL